MYFPTLGEIATRDVITIDAAQTAAEAVTKMMETGHRSIVVEKEDGFFLLNAVDALRVQSEKGSLNVALEGLELVRMQTKSAECNVLEVLNELPRSMEYICVSGAHGELVGLVSDTDIIVNIDPETMMENFRLQDFLKMNRRTKWVSKGQPTFDVLSHLVNHDSDHTVIVEAKKPVGILTTKDVVRLVHSKVDLTKPIECYMTTPVDTMDTGVSVKEALEYIRDKQYKRIVVTDEQGQIAGVISQKELISLSYGKWATLMKESQNELREINKMLEQRSFKYEKLASTDPLTGLYNRYKFSELFVSSYSIKVQRDNALSLIMLDIDHFKKINDKYGHSVGDHVLVQVAHVLLHQVRSIDIVARWGGEEFIILLPTADLSQAQEIAEHIRSAIASKSIESVGHVKASFGVTEVKEGDSMESAIERADEGLYQAKEAGRNCVKVIA